MTRKGEPERAEYPVHLREYHSPVSAPADFNRHGLFSDWAHVFQHHGLALSGREPQWLNFTDPYGNTPHARYRGAAADEGEGKKAQDHASAHQKRSEHKGESSDEHKKLLSASEQNIENALKSNPHDFKHVFNELDHLRAKSGKNIEGDLQEINKTLHEKGLLKGLSIVGDNRNGEQGWAVVSEDRANKEHDGHRDKTMVSTSHAPHESSVLQHHYHGMHYRRGHYNGWHQSVEGGGGAHGGFDRHAVGGHVPDGARKELIEKALKLAGVPVTEQNIAAVNKIVTRESGWNPNITNNWDSNARAGHPSTGLMQTIPSTFKAFALPGMNNNMHDPLSNLVAGIRYAEHRYGRHGVSGVARVAGRPGGY